MQNQEEDKIKKYGFVSTGNFNEYTAKIYTDYTLFTSNQKLLKDVAKVFNFLEVNYEFKRYKHLIVSPHYTYQRLVELIDNEIQNKSLGRKSKIRLKLNSITNYKIITDVKLLELLLLRELELLTFFQVKLMITMVTHKFLKLRVK